MKAKILDIFYLVSFPSQDIDVKEFFYRISRHADTLPNLFRYDN